jgi:Fis family transcriptional regulator
MMGNGVASIKPAQELRGPETQPLSFHVKQALERYFTDLNGHAPADLYDLVMTEVERPLLEEVMRRTRGNISKAAQHLGLNRATLRKKLERHGIAS